VVWGKLNLNDSVRCYGAMVRDQMDSMTWKFCVHVLMDKHAQCYAHSVNLSFTNVLFPTTAHTPLHVSPTYFSHYQGAAIL